MSAPATHFPPVSAARRCPACNSPISIRAAVCALCDTVLDPAALAAAASAPKVKVRDTVRIWPALAAFGSRALLVVAVLMLLVGGVMAAFVNMMQNRLERRIGRIAAEFEAERAHDRWRSIDSAIAGAAQAIGAGAARDDVAAATIAAFGRRGRDADAYLREGGAPAAVATHPAVPAQARLASFRALPARPTKAKLDSLAGDTLDGRLSAWRALARSAPLPAMWPYSARIGELRDPYVVPELPFGASKELAGRNASAALVAFAAGDAHTASTRIRENVAAAGQLMRVPTMLNYLVGRSIIAEAAAQLAQLARATGDSALAREASRLDYATEGRANAYRLNQALPAYFADPGDPRGPALVGDRRLSPAQRVLALGGVTAGFCLRTRELLFGVSPDRRDALQAAAAQLADIDGAEAMIALNARWLDDLIERPVETLRTMGRLRGATRMPRSASVPLVGGATARMVTCMRML